MKAIYFFLIYLPVIVFSQSNEGIKTDYVVEIIENDASKDSLSIITIDSVVIMRIDQFKDLGFLLLDLVKQHSEYEYQIDGLNINFVIDDKILKKEFITDISNREIISFKSLSKKRLRKRYNYQSDFSAISIYTKPID